MARIITISREFGSGGRELGKRLSEALGIPCYDHQIIEMVAKEYGFDQNYVAHMSENDLRAAYPSTIARGFVAPNYALQQSVQIAAAQHKLIRSLAEKGDCVIVGRCADTILEDMHPLNLFVYADQKSKVDRCIARAGEKEELTVKEILKKMKQIDKSRAEYRRTFGDGTWGRKENYHLCVNTSGKEIKSLIPGLVAYAKAWFGEE